MNEILSIIPEDWGTILLAAIGVCAAVATLVPAPKENSNTFYKAVYKLLSWCAMNIGNAKNGSTTKNP